MLSASYPVRQVCRVLAYPASSFYYQSQQDDETALKAAIQRLCGEWPTYGYRRITALLKREHFPVNRKRVARLMGELGMQGQPPERYVHTTNSEHAYPRYPNLVQHLAIAHPDQVWVGDITYVALRNEFVYLAVLMDVFTRQIRGWHLSRHLDGALTLTALRRALLTHRPEIHHSDQGVQYAATAYIHVLQDVSAQVSMAAVGEATENGYAERLMRTIKEEEVSLHDYCDFHDAYQHLGRFLDEVYQHKRIHSSLGYLTPVEFECSWLSQHPLSDPLQFAPP